MRGLLARAELHRVTGNTDKARRDLDEAFSLASRCGMGLYLADCHLEYARFYLASGDSDQAREHLDDGQEDDRRNGLPPPRPRSQRTRRTASFSPQSSGNPIPALPFPRSQITNLKSGIRPPTPNSQPLSIFPAASDDSVVEAPPI